MKYIKKFEHKDDIIPIPKESKHDFLIYYKIHSDKSIDKFNVALDKLNIKKEVYYCWRDSYDRLMMKVLKSDVVYLCIETTYRYEILNTIDNIKEEFWGKFNSFLFGGDVYIEDYEVDAKKYNI